MMKISPAFLFFSVYFISNLILGGLFYSSGVLGGDFVGEKIKDESLYLIVYVSEILLMCVFWLLMRGCFNAVKVKKRYEINGNGISVLVFIVQLCFLLYSYKTGVGQLSEDYYNTSVDNPFKYLFTFLNADYLFLAYLCVSKKSCKYNTALYLVSNIYRGWFAGALVYLFFIFLAKRYTVSGIRLRYVIIAILGFILASPGLYFVKYVTRGAESADISRVQIYYNGDLYSQVLNAAFSRFQHISETYSIVEKIDTIREGYDKKEFVPFFFENPAKRQLGNALGYNGDMTITQYSAEKVLGKIPGNIHVGLLTWLLIDPVLTFSYVFFMIASFIILAFLMKKLSFDNMWPYFLWSSVMFAMHGWFTAYFMVIWSFFVIYLMNNLSSLLARSYYKS